MPEQPNERIVDLTPINGGWVDSKFESLLKPTETPNPINVDFDDSSVRASFGMIPFNRQSAPPSGILCRPDPALSPLYFTASTASLKGKAVPLRGYVVLPYSQDTDIGGRFDLEGDPLGLTPTFYNRRGRAFEINISTRIPPEEKLYETETRGAGAPAVGAEAAGFTGYSFDEAEDECFCIIQKGGDRTNPMSWALAVVNIGRGIGLTGVPPSRPSNYALVWMWLDAVGFGTNDQTGQRYNLTTGQLPTGAATQNATQAYRAILIHKYVEPGKRYSIAVQLGMDTGSPGAVASNTAWAQNGTFKVWVSEDGGSPTSYTAVQTTSATPALSGLEVYKGPTDSIEYLLKYGIRFAGRDEMFLGLGQRFIPWATCGFIPTGMDLTALAHGGFQMVDRSANVVGGAAGFYPAGVHTLTAAHTIGDTYLVMNHQGLVLGNTNGGQSPWATGGPAAPTAWQGLGGGVIGDANPNALRRYAVVTTGNQAVAGQRGAILPIGTYTEVGASYRLDIAAPGTMASFAATPVLIQAFRWHQRSIEVSEVRIWAAPRGYDTGGDAVLSARRKLSQRMSIDLDDATEPDLATLLAYWPCDDSEGTLVREKIVGGFRNGHMAPFGLSTTEGGERGTKMTFLSGEGEAPCIDLSQNPIFLREVGNMLRGSSQGFALEISCVFTGASYAIQDSSITLPDKDSTGATLTGSRPRFVPEILSWDVSGPTMAGMSSTPKPIITLTHRGALTSGNTIPFRFPMGFSVEVANHTDQENIEPIVPSDLLPAYLDATPAPQARYAYDAPWVGKLVTIQIGVQSTGTADQYDVYIAMSPKDAFMPASGDPSDAEFVYWTAGGGSYSATYANYFTAAHLTIRPKDLVRSVITLGRWNCGTLGYCELQPRMLVDELRVFGCSAPGALPATNGGILTNRNGKLEGNNCFPPRELTIDDILQPLGPGLTSANVTEGSVTVTPTPSSRFFIAEARAAREAVKHTYLYVPGDKHEILDEETLGTDQEEFYWIPTVDQSAVSATNGPGKNLTLLTPFADATRNGASAYSLRLLFYTSFGDDIRDKLPTFGAGRAFFPGTGSADNTTVADVILTDVFWENVSPVTGGMRLRFYWPGGRISLRDLLPKWVRGHVVPRTNPILGGHPHNGKIYMAAKGSLFELDDRWRHDGPTETLQKALAFRARQLESGVTCGLQDDRVDLTTASVVQFAASATDSYVTVYDAWFKLDEVGEFQTIMWIGDPTTNAAQNASATAGLHKLHLILRLTHGRPQFVFGSTAFYTGTTVPEKGFFVATAATPVRAGEWSHVRWLVKTRASGTIVMIPWCKVNGKTSTVTVNARDNNAAITQPTDWLRASTIVAPGSGAHALLGIAHDSYRSAKADIAFTSNALGTNLMPQRITGYLHSLCGSLAQVIVTRQNVWTGTEPPDINPKTLDYSDPIIQSAQFNALSTKTGIGHRVFEEGEDQFGFIVSHPFISLWHELGSQDEPAAFADFGQVVYATNGSRPARIDRNGTGGLAGVLPPTTPLEFKVERFPFWKPNVALVDPVPSAAVGAALQINHYDNHGNNFLVNTPADATGYTEMAWTKDTSTGDNKVMAFKCYLKFRDTSGRQLIWAKRTGVESGGFFIETMDGRLVIGWYDQYMKRRVFLETDAPVFEPGLWHYLNVRKLWPQQDTVEGNWENEFFSEGRIRRLTMTAPLAGTFVVGEQLAGAVSGTGIVTKSFGAASTIVEYTLTSALEMAGLVTGGSSGATGTASTVIRPMKDKAVVRRFSLATASSGFEHPLEAKVTGAIRNAVSFTTPTVAMAGGLQGQPTGTTATGQVTLPGAKFTGAAAGVVNVAGGIYAGVRPFHADMVGMYWQWGTVGGGAASFVGNLYKIVIVNSSVQITVVNAGTATNPNFAGIVAATEGAVFSGIGLMKSQAFDTSKKPDDGDAGTPYTISAFGSLEVSNPLSGVAPFNAEFASFGWTMARMTSGENAQPFEDLPATADTSQATGAATNDPLNVGTDTFAGAITSATVPGELHFDPWVAGPPQRGTWLIVDGQTYAGVGAGPSSQPRSDLALTLDTNPAGSTHTGTLQVTPLQSATAISGARFIRAVFFDLDQNERSNPGPELKIKPSEEDQGNPSAQVRYVISNLPFPRQDGNFEVEIYMGLTGGSSTALFLVNVVPAGTREIAISKTEADIATGVPLSFANGEPPRCFFLTASQGRIIYGKLETQLDGVAYSNIGFPVSLDYSIQFPRFSDGLGAELNMLYDLDGFTVLGKRQGIGALSIDRNGIGIIQTISKDTGCVAFQSVVAIDYRLFFLSDAGIEVMSRTGVTNLGMPVYVSEKIKRFLTDKLDRRFLNRVSAAYNKKRRQYVMTAHAIGEQRTNRRISVEFDPEVVYTPLDQREVSGFRFGYYEHPNVTCLIRVPAPDGGIDQLVGGTALGMALWMDRQDSAQLAAGEDNGIWGFPRIVCGAAGALSRIAVSPQLSGSIDSSPEGPRGAPLRYVASNGVEHVVTCIGSESSFLHFDRVQDLGCPLGGHVAVGGKSHHWETPWMHMGDRHRKKRGIWLNIECAIQRSGTLTVDLYTDMDPVTVQQTQDIDLTQAVNRVDLKIEGKWIKAAISTPPVSEPTSFDIAGMTFRVEDGEQD